MSKYKFDKLFFQKPSMINSYWAGFIAADGNVAFNRNTINIDLATKDRNHLVRFREDVNGNFKIEDRDRGVRGIQSRIRVDCKDWKNDLCSVYNITPRKTLTLKPPTLDNFLSLCFLAGYIDGDGSISNGYIHIVGTRDLLLWTKQIVDKIFPSDIPNRQCNVRKVKHANCYEFTIGGHRSRRLVSIIRTLPIPVMYRKWGTANDK